MTWLASRPKYARVFYRGLPYRIDLMMCRRALVQRQIDGGLDSMQSLAGAVGISRSTASRFFSGRPTSLGVTLKIAGALHLTFEQVATPEDDQDESDGEAGVGARRQPRPRGPKPQLSEAVDGRLAE